MKLNTFLIYLLTVSVAGAATALITLNISRQDTSECSRRIDALQDSLFSLQTKLLSDSVEQFIANVDNIPGRVKEKIYYTRNGHKWRNVYSYDDQGRIKNIKAYEQDDWKYSGKGWGLVYEYKYSYKDKSVTVKTEDWSEMVLTGGTTTYILE